MTKKEAKSHFSTPPPQTGQMTHWWPNPLNDGSRVFLDKSVHGEVSSLRTTSASAGEAESGQVLPLIRQSHDGEAVPHVHVRGAADCAKQCKKETKSLLRQVEGEKKRTFACAGEARMADTAQDDVCVCRRGTDGRWDGLRLLAGLRLPTLMYGESFTFLSDINVCPQLLAFGHYCPHLTTATGLCGPDPIFW